ncbi:MAG: DUF6879 family protein [Trebonia sp.]
MRPPATVVKDSRRLDLDEFGAQFAAAWSRLDERFLKLECWQEYQELEAVESQNAYNRGDINLARELLRGEAESDRPLYQDVKRRNIYYARIRLVHLPLTAYLDYEMMAYATRAQLGENIRVVKFPETIPLPSEEYFDFLLFDRHIALIHDYGSDAVGVQSGGWLVDNPEIIKLLEDKALTALRDAVPVERFLTVEGG